MEKQKNRSLYDCMEARYPKDGRPMLYCREGHPFPNAASVKAFQREAPLRLSVCQDCPAFNDADAEG